MENDTCENHDHNKIGECLVIDWKGAVEEREGYEKKEALAHKSMDAKQEQEYIYKVNKENRTKVAEANKAPF